MQEFWWQLKDTDSFTVYMALGFAAAVCFFIYEFIGAHVLAIVSAPLLVAGGVAMPTLMAQGMITLSYDKTVNTISNVAIGTLLTLFVILLVNWLVTITDEYRVRRTKLAPLAPRPSEIRRRPF
jgi:uncharacterized membrane protein